MRQKTPSQCGKNGYFILVKGTIDQGDTIGNSMHQLMLYKIANSKSDRNARYFIKL